MFKNALFPNRSKIFVLRKLKMSQTSHRIEKDTLGEVHVPKKAKWKAQTQRAIENFPISQYKLPPIFIKNLALVKHCAAKANSSTLNLSPEKADPISKIAFQIYEGNYLEEFPVDVFQTGSGTSTNCNMNEVISTLVEEHYKMKVHPNDDVNMSQSSNDVIPTTTMVSIVHETSLSLIPSIQELINSIDKKASEWNNICKSGRTHLMDAVPITFDQELHCWSSQLHSDLRSLKFATEHCHSLPIGGTAVGTGLNAPMKYKEKVVENLNSLTGMSFTSARNLFESISNQDRIVSYSGQLKTLAVTLTKICNDIRLMNSGPCSGMNEIKLTPLQPGSSIMPGKINPVIPESTLMACAHIIGSDSTITIGGQSGLFQLNTMMPLIAYHSLENIRILTNSCNNLAHNCINSMRINQDQVDKTLSRNPILITSLNPSIGYEKGAIIAKKCMTENKTIKEIALSMNDLPNEDLSSLLDPLKLSKPHKRFPEIGSTIGASS